MSTKGRENWEKFKAGYVVNSSYAEEPNTGNAGRDRWNALKKTIDIRSTAPRQTAQDDSSGAKKGFFDRLGLTVSGGAKGSLAGNMDAMGVAYELGQSGRTQRYTEELREAQWAVARAKHDYDVDPNNWQTKDALDTAIAKMKGFADTLGKGAYEQALTAAYDAASKFETEDLKALYNGLGVVDPEQGTGVQQQAASAARDLAYGVQESASKDLQEAKEGASKFGQMLVDAGASMTQMGIDSAVSGLMGFRPTKWNGGNKIIQEALGIGEKVMTPGAMIPFATRAFGGSTMDARQDGADLKGQVLYGGAQAAKEVFTEKMFNIALPFAKAYGKGGLDSVVENGIRKAAEKLGKSDVGRAALERMLKFGASAASEGLEEFVGDFFEWQMPRIYGGDTDSFAETFSNALYDFAVGTISGAAGGAVEGGVDLYNDHAQAREAKKVYGDQAQELVNESKELNPDNDLAKKYQERLDNGKKLSGFQLNRLIEQNEADMATGDKAKIKSAAEARLTELGETGDVSRIAQAITKRTAGEALTRSEQKLIENSRYGRRVSSELNPENVEAGDYSTGWAERLGTDRVNVEVYRKMLQEAENAPQSTPVAQHPADTATAEKTQQAQPGAQTEHQQAMQETEQSVTQALTEERSGETANAPANLEEFSKQFGKQSGAFIHTYQEGQDVAEFTAAYKAALEYGTSSVPLRVVKNMDSLAPLTDAQREIAWTIGRGNANELAQKHGKTTGTPAQRKKGTVRAAGMKLWELESSLNDQQRRTFKVLRNVTEATGVNVVLYRSGTDAEGNFIEADGRFSYKDDTIYVDLNSGLANIHDVNSLGQYTMMRTFTHEFTHFMEKNAPMEWDELRTIVFETMQEKLDEQGGGLTVDDLIHRKLDTYRAQLGETFTYEEASREVVADALADILPDSHFMENLYRKNKSLFERVLDKLKEFVKNLREYFAHVNPNTKVEAAALKENTENGMRYLEKIVEAFDKTAEAAVENYQQGTTESTAESKTQYKTRGKYWRPDLKDSEWKLLERRMAEEIGSSENYLDDATKWVYAEEKGIQVFALFGIGDGTDATPLYASAGRTARADAKMLMDYTVEENQYDGNRKDLNTLLEGYGRSNGNGSRNFSDGKRGSAKNRVAGLSGGSQRSDTGGTAERSSEDQRGVKEKFSLRDSAGHELTEAQQEYFKDSKVRDKDGNLKPVYHGSAAVFTEFSADFMSRHGSSEGQGFYFTDYKPMAQGYEKNGGQLLVGYLDIKNPLSDSKVTLSAAEVKRLIRAVDPTGDDLVCNYDSGGGIGYPSRAWYNRAVEDTLRATMSTSDSDSEILAELANGMGDPGKVLKTVRELLGYDGYIVEGKYDNATVYVAFDSSQFKNADNKTPTADPDIRYSLREIGGKVMPILDVQNDTRDYKVAEAYLKTLVDTEHPFATILMDAQPVYIGKDLPGEYKSSEYTKSLRKATRTVKMQAVTNLDEMLLLAENGEWRENVKDKHKKDAKNGWYRYSTQFALPVLDIKKAVDHYTVYSGTLIIRNDADGKSYLYDLLDIKKEKVISSTSFSAQGRSEVFEPKPSREQYMQNPRESQPEKTGNDRHALRDVALSDREILVMTEESSVKNGRERELLAEYKDKSEQLKGYESRLSANRAELTGLSYTEEKKNAKRILHLKDEIIKDTNRVEIVQTQLRRLEDNRVLQDLLNREKDAIRVQQAARMLELEKKLAEYRGKYGVISGGEKAAREVLLPKKSGENEKISQTVRTILEAKATPEEMVPDIEELALEGKYSYEAYSDKAAIAAADSEIKRVGWVQALTDWKAAIKSGSVSKKNTAMGWALYNNAANSGDTKTALDVLGDMVGHQRSAAQALQATRILKQLSPETQLYQAQRSIESLQTELNDAYGDSKAPKLKIDQELAEQFMKAADQAERDAVLANIYRDIGKQMPSRFKDKWNAWRYLAMLCNVRTHARNILGNAFFMPVVAAKDAVATGIEKTVYRLSGGKMERSKEFVLGKGGKALLEAAAQDYAKVADIAMGGGKYNDFANANKYIEEGRVIFQSKVPGLKQVSRGLEAARKANSTALDAEDAWFSKPHYAYAMAQYCKANGITAEMIAKGGEKVEKAREYAIHEAQKATYRDTNAFSQAISELGRMGGRYSKNGAKRVISTAMEGILPFRKTPANILARGVEYSPIWLLRGIYQATVGVKKGTATAAEAIDSISAGLTGTGLLALGAFLAAQGLVRGHGDDDDKENTFMELVGHQAYALELPDGTSITLDWLAPECLPFFVGVNLWERANDGDDPVTMADFFTAITQVTEPMLEMSCLQSLNDVFDSVGYASNNGLAELPTALANAATSYVAQGIPTILGQAERTGDGLRYTTFTSKNSKLTGDMQYALGRASAKIPGWDYSQIPYIDAWGRTEDTGGVGTRVFNNFLNPAYTSTVDMSDMEQELLRLYEATGENVLPQRASKYFNVDKKRVDLTGEQYVKYAEKKGSEAYKWLTELTQNAAYNRMSDEEKADCVAKIYSAANEVAKADVVSSYKPTKWVREALNGKGIVNAAIAKVQEK